MKKIIFAVVTLLLLNIKVNAQINNLNDLLEVSELSMRGLINNLQYTWELKSPQSDYSEKGYVTERYPFVYNNLGKRQLLKRIITLRFEPYQRIEMTSFFLNDLGLLTRIIKNLPNQGFEKSGGIKNETMYEDGNRMITIIIGSSENKSLPKGNYMITVVVNN